MSIDFYDNVKGKFLGITLDCVTKDTEEENSSPFQVDDILSNSNLQENMSEESKFNEQTSSNQLIFDPNNNRPRIRYINLKAIGSRLPLEAQANMAIARAVPLPASHELIGRNTYWFVTTEPVEVIHSSGSKMEEQLTKTISTTLYLLQIRFRTVRAHLTFRFGDKSEVHIRATRWMEVDKDLLMIQTQSEYLELGNVIGEGSFGTIYLAEWKGVKYAVKKFKLYDNKKEEIEKEATALQLVQHECIVTLASITHDQDGKIMLVMEYMEDGSLADFLKNNKLTKEAAIQIALDVAEGLQYLHSQRIIHRDLKSANVLLYANKTRAKLTDFGTVRIFGESSKATTVLGTVGFMAPEIMQEEPYNAKADIYSFGALMFHMLTNKLLPVFFSDKVRANKISEVQDTEFQNLIKQCCEIEPTARPTIEQCIQKLNEMRQQSLENNNNM